MISKIHNGVVFTKGRSGKLWGWALNGNGRKALVELGEAVWSEKNGALPAGGKLSYKDGDATNCDLANIVVTVRGKAWKRPAKTKTKATK